MAKQNPFKGVKAPKALQKPAAAKVEKASGRPIPLRNTEYTPAADVTFEPRAGFTSYLREMQERLQDIVEAGERDRLYIVPVRLTPKQYTAVLQATIATAQQHGIDDWTEQDEIETQLKAFPKKENA